MSTLIDEWDADRLRAYIAWCEDADVVPAVNGHGAVAYDAGCGCCAGAVDVPAEFRPKDTA